MSYPRGWWKNWGEAMTSLTNSQLRLTKLKAYSTNERVNEMDAFNNEMERSWNRAHARHRFWWIVPILWVGYGVFICAISWGVFKVAKYLLHAGGVS